MVVGVEAHAELLGIVAAEVVHPYVHLGTFALCHALGCLYLGVEVIIVGVAHKEAVDVDVFVGRSLHGKVEGDKLLVGPLAEVYSRCAPFAALQVGVVYHTSHLALAVGCLHLYGNLGGAAFSCLVVEHELGSRCPAQVDLARTEISDVLGVVWHDVETTAVVVARLGGEVEV